MAKHSSASVREHTPHANRTSRTNTIINALKRRAEAVLNDRSVDPESRAIIRYALEINNPWLADPVRSADSAHLIVGRVELSPAPELFDDDASEEKILEMVEIICRGGIESMAALLELMAIIEASTQPKVLANAIQQYACDRSAESKP